LLALGRQ